MAPKVNSFIVYFITAASFFAWIFSIDDSNLNIDDFGLIHSLSPLFFLSLGLLLISFILALNVKVNKGLLPILILLLIIFLFLTPAIIEGTTRFRPAYKVYEFTDYIMRNGHISSTDVWYHNWPGTFISMSILLNMVVPNNDLSYWMYFPFAVQILYFFPVHTILYTLFKNDEKKKWMGIWIFYILNYVNQDYLSPQAVAYLFFLIFLSSIVKVIVDRYSPNIANNISYKIIGVVLFSSLVTIHVITPIFIISIFLITTLFIPNSTYKKSCYKSTLLYIIIISAWAIYGAYAYVGWQLGPFVSETFNLDLLFSKNIGHRVSGSLAHVIISKAMIYSAVVSGIMSIIGIILSYHRKEKIHSTNVMMAPIGCAILLPVPMSPYGGEMIMRLFLFSLPLMAFFIPQVHGKKFSIILILFLTIMTSTHIITHYGNEKYDHVSAAELSSYDFFYGKVKDKDIVGGYLTYMFKFPERYNLFEHEDLVWDGEKYLSNVSIPLPKNYSVVISKGDIEKYQVFSNTPNYIYDFEEKLSGSNNYLSVYTNGDVNIYKSNN